MRRMPCGSTGVPRCLRSPRPPSQCQQGRQGSRGPSCQIKVLRSDPRGRAPDSGRAAFCSALRPRARQTSAVARRGPLLRSAQIRSTSPIRSDPIRRFEQPRLCCAKPKATGQDAPGAEGVEEDRALGVRRLTLHIVQPDHLAPPRPQPKPSQQCPKRKIKISKRKSAPESSDLFSSGAFFSPGFAPKDPCRSPSFRRSSSVCPSPCPQHPTLLRS
jgi:hypothetical protein